MEMAVPHKSQKKYFIKTFGCQMNIHDTERMAAILTEQGYVGSEAMEAADVIIFNSCSVRDKAEQKAFSGVGWLKEAKKKNPRLKLGFTGCVAQQEGKAVFQSAPYIDFVLGTDSIDMLPEVLYRSEQGEKKILQVGFDPANDYSLETKVLPGRVSAYVNIMKGCDNFCTYCIVPFTRGREKSRPIEAVVQDIERLVASGVKEVMLLGQNVNSYGKSLGGKKAGQSFARLLRQIDLIPGLHRLRYTTSHPKDFDEEMIACHAELKRLVPHLHLPVQSGSAKVLKRMKRYVPIEIYIDRLKKVRQAVPGIALSTDIIVGFPGEEDKDFQATMDLLEKVRFDNIYAYAYSPRPGTAALKFGDPVPSEVKTERLNQLQHRQHQIQTEINQNYLNQVVEVLVEGSSKTNDAMLMGRIPQWKVVNFARPQSITATKALIGNFARVKIIKATAFALKGELVHDC